MAPNEAQHEWVARVLGVAPSGSSGEPALPQGADFPVAWRKAVAQYRDASDSVDDQIGKLQTVLKGSGDGELAEIAEFGLNAVTGGFKVPLMALLHELDAAAPKPQLVKRARSVVSRFRGHLGQDERVLACDENPFGVSMTVRRTLGGALEGLDAALQMAPA